MTKEKKTVKTKEHAKPYALEYGVFLLILMISTVGAFIASWIWAWSKSGAYGVMMNGLVMIVIGGIGVHHYGSLMKENVDNEDDGG